MAGRFISEICGMTIRLCAEEARCRQRLSWVITCMSLGKNLDSDHKCPRWTEFLVRKATRNLTCWPIFLSCLPLPFALCRIRGTLLRSQLRCYFLARIGRDASFGFRWLCWLPRTYF